ncbi:hypothetical protein [Brachybacterium sp. ACRRE]|uniref:hypothetical protein n=1 Tax=Brachybacterium sp. ACRRE TaxID=2918184 RepID=UPI001EF19E2F|nr:hypothetical protein [Brachybacterium sp. ACRRE]MCG7308279.1 hypothetical protein [Brachybacterium sp. ACRRE]
MTSTTSEDLCTLLDRMSWGRSASRHVRPSRPARLHALPPTMWVTPAGEIGGHKAASRGVLPATVEWDEGTICVAAPDPTEHTSTTWTLNAAGMHRSGAIVLAEGAPLAGRPSRNMWSRHTAPVMSTYEAGQALDDLEEQGELAKWEMLQSLEHFAHEKIGAISSAICREISGADDTEAAPHLLDDEQMGVVVTNVIYGTSGTTSRILRGLERCLDPATTRNVDPVRYLTTQVRRDLADEVRVAIGDPQVGSRVRRIARGLGTGATLDQIIERYNQAHTSDRISTSRAIRALTVAPTLESSAVRSRFEVRHA